MGSRSIAQENNALRHEIMQKDIEIEGLKEFIRRFEAVEVSTKRQLADQKKRIIEAVKKYVKKLNEAPGWNEMELDGVIAAIKEVTKPPFKEKKRKRKKRILPPGAGTDE